MLELFPHVFGCVGLARLSQELKLWVKGLGISVWLTWFMILQALKLSLKVWGTWFCFGECCDAFTFSGRGRGCGDASSFVIGHASTHSHWKWFLWF